MSRKSKSDPHKGTERADASTGEPARLGPSLRALRKQNDWTLLQVSERTGLSVSTLSKVENDKLSLTYDKLVRLSRGLSVDIVQLFAPGATPAPAPTKSLPSGGRSINHGGKGRTIETGVYAHQYLAEDLVTKRLVPMIGEIHVRSVDAFLDVFGKLVGHAGEEFAYVLEGELELHTEHYAPLRLKQGDSIYFDSGMGHAYINAGPGRCRILCLCSGSEASMLGQFNLAEPTPEAAAPRRPKKGR